MCPATRTHFKHGFKVSSYQEHRKTLFNLSCPAVLASRIIVWMLCCAKYICFPKRRLLLLENHLDLGHYCLGDAVGVCKIQILKVVNPEPQTGHHFGSFIYLRNSSMAAREICFLCSCMQ